MLCCSICVRNSSREHEFACCAAYPHDAAGADAFPAGSSCSSASAAGNARSSDRCFHQRCTSPSRHAARDWSIRASASARRHSSFAARPALRSHSFAIAARVNKSQEERIFSWRTSTMNGPREHNSRRKQEGRRRRTGARHRRSRGSSRQKSHAQVAGRGASCSYDPTCSLADRAHTEA